MSTFNPSQIIIQANAHDTLKNEAVDNTASVTIPGSSSVATASRLVASQDITIGEAGSIADLRFQTSRDTTRDYLASTQQSFTRTGSLGAYSLFVGCFRVSATVVRVQAFIVNPYGSTMTSQSGNETFTFKLRTYRAPF
jgi:hypothetical protein